MQIDPTLLLGHEREIGRLRADISRISQNAACKVPSYEQLTDRSVGGWDMDQVKAGLKKQPANFEPLLFKLHFKRKSRFTATSRIRILNFLAAAYQLTRDIRYFNEFLWFYEETQQSSALWLVTLDNFIKNLGPDQRHHFPACSAEDMQTFVEVVTDEMEKAHAQKADTKMHIGLLGSPTFFPKVRSELLKDGFPVECYFIPYHPEKTINMVLNNRFAFFVLRLVKKALFRFVRLDFDRNDPRIEAVLRKGQLDIGFHKLGFIIKNNVIAGFKQGLINDHWGLLPFVRGRSTIEYSILLGIPLFTTSHYIKEGVDLGDIIAIYSYVDAPKTCSTVKEIRRVIRGERDRRAIDSIRILSKNKAAIIKNEDQLGQTFYSMHEALEVFINEGILASSGTIQ